MFDPSQYPNENLRICFRPKCEDDYKAFWAVVKAVVDDYLVEELDEYKPGKSRIIVTPPRFDMPVDLYLAKYVDRDVKASGRSDINYVDTDNLSEATWLLLEYEPQAAMWNLQDGTTVQVNGDELIVSKQDQQQRLSKEDVEWLRLFLSGRKLDPLFSSCLASVEHNHGSIDGLISTFREIANSLFN